VSDHRTQLAADLVECFSEEVKYFTSDIIPLPIDFQEFQEVCKFIKAELEESPKDALLCMGAAAHLVLCSAKNFKLSHINKINVRLYNTGATIALKKLKAAFIKKLVTVHGTIVKVSTVKPLVL